MTFKSKEEHSQQNFFSDWDTEWDLNLKSPVSYSEKPRLCNQYDHLLTRPNAKMAEKTHLSYSSAAKDPSFHFDSLSDLTDVLNHHCDKRDFSFKQTPIRQQTCFASPCDGVKTLTDRLKSFSLGERESIRNDPRSPPFHSRLFSSPDQSVDRKPFSNSRNNLFSSHQQPMQQWPNFSYAVSAARHHPWVEHAESTPFDGPSKSIQKPLTHASNSSSNTSDNLLLSQSPAQVVPESLISTSPSSLRSHTPTVPATQASTSPETVQITPRSSSPSLCLIVLIFTLGLMFGQCLKLRSPLVHSMKTMENTQDVHLQLSKPYAIQLTDVTVHLGKKDVLRSVNLSIEQGGIFALLGPSGCGKTSLIRTLIGRLHPVENHDGRRGTILILGHRPHAFGQLVGFMPQEMALHGTNTIDEELYFYGRLANMSNQYIQQRSQFLSTLLELPPRRKFISKLSGGQQRRVSFAIALLHEPRLLILDEPTVGVDPLLRRKIWDHLTEITMKGDVTAILTTHYIEEARQANQVSFMRHGQLLETGRPHDLLVKHNQQNLEDVFLELCQGKHMLEIQLHAQEKTHQHKSLTIASKICNCGRSALSSCCGKSPCCSAIRACGRPALGRSLYALLVKDIIKFQRNPFMLVMQFLVPILQIALFCLCVGRKLTNVPMGFVSRETVRAGSVTELVLNQVDRQVLNLIEYPTMEEATQRLRMGHLAGIFDIGANFSRELMEKVQHCSLMDANKYEDSQLSVYVDQTNRQMVYSVAEEFMRILKNIDLEFNLGHWTSGLANQSLFKIGEMLPDIPQMEYTFTHFMVPGIVLSVIFFFNVALTALSIVTEQTDGTQERVWITGVKSNEIILSQLMIHSVILLIQIVIVLFTALIMFQVPSHGNIIYSSLLTLFQGFCGMTFGLVLSTIFTTEVNAHQATMAIFYPVLLLSGIVWPLEGQPLWMRTITKWLPMTKAIEAMRGVLLKGWGIEHMVVQQAFLVTFLWSMVFLILTLFIFNFRRL